MKTVLTWFYFVLVLFCLLKSNAQSQPPAPKNAVDSLMLELRHTNSDTARVRIRYWIGHKTNVARVGFWDSLASDAHRFRARRMEGKALNTLGFHYMSQLGLDDTALKCFKKSCEIAKETGKKEA